MNRFLHSLETKATSVRKIKATHVSEFVVARFNAWRYGPRLSSEQLAKDARQLELARNALSSPYSHADRLAIAANLGRMAHRLTDELVVRGDEHLVEDAAGGPIASASDGHAAGGKAIFIARN